MSDTPRPPLLRRMSPGAWMALIWCGITAYVFLRPPSGPLQIPIGPLLAMAVVVGVAAPLLRRRPLTALAVLLAGSVAETLAMYAFEVMLLQFLVVNIAVYFIAATRPRRVSVAAAVLTLGVVAAYFIVVRGYAGDATELAAASTVVIAWLIGNSRRQGQVHAEELRARATAQAVTAERLRIARELHDMVAHSIGIIAIQAGMGSRVIDTQPAEARNALDAIEATSRETLSGLRRMLVALRRGAPDSPGEAAPLDPAPGLADLDALAEATMAAGVHVDVRWLGQRRPLPADIDLSAFRIIQEAVTNVVRHASTGTCRVSIDCQERELSIEVVDDGHGGIAGGTGYGLVGMRERVGLLNGDLSAGPRPEGGFRVAARLPVPAGAR
ncbi:sensor histidine kinase [Actinomadura scrupuli]|uniref:sensor histidine kinase n=1 Tax=Actinomadura scrupuli TaxID=559629 RepID=UPI003D9827D1